MLPEIGWGVICRRQGFLFVLAAQTWKRQTLVSATFPISATGHCNVGFIAKSRMFVNILNSTTNLNMQTDRSESLSRQITIHHGRPWRDKNQSQGFRSSTAFNSPAPKPCRRWQQWHSVAASYPSSIILGTLWGIILHRRSLVSRPTARSRTWHRC